MGNISPSSTLQCCVARSKENDWYHSPSSSYHLLSPSKGEKGCLFNAAAHGHHLSSLGCGAADGSNSNPSMFLFSNTLNAKNLRSASSLLSSSTNIEGMTRSDSTSSISSLSSEDEKQYLRQAFFRDYEETKEPHSGTDSDRIETDEESDSGQEHRDKSQENSSWRAGQNPFFCRV